MVTRWVVVPVLAAALLLFGCATKKFVREELQERDEQITKLGSDLGEERARIGDVGGQVGEVRSKTETANRRADEAAGIGTQALKRADDASARAGQALTKAEETEGRFNRAWTNRNRRTVAETIVVRFGFDKADLDDRAQTALLDALKVLKDDPNVFVTLEGYTDSTGPANYNLQLSQRRAESVRRFMVQNGVDLHRIQSIGLGPSTTKASQKRDQDRRVAIHLVVPAE